MTRIPSSIVETSRNYLVYLYNQIRQQTGAPPGEVLAMISNLIIEISKNEQSIEFEAHNMETQLNILATRIEAVMDTLYNGQDGKNSEIADFFELAAHVEGYRFENLCLIYSVNTSGNLSDWFSDLRTCEAWRSKGFDVVDGAVPVFLLNSDNTAWVKVYDCMYVTDYQKPKGIRNENINAQMEHDITVLIQRSGIESEINRKIDVRAKYDGRNNIILGKPGDDTVELMRCMTKAVADAYINQEVKEGSNYGITGYYDLASDIAAFIVCARRGMVFNSIMNDRIRLFHRLFYAEDRESFFAYIKLILKIADRIGELLNRNEVTR